MAWVTEYDMTWRSPTAYGHIYLQRDGGTYQQSLLLLYDSLEINDIIPSWEEHVAKMNCSFTIVNNLADFYELMPLMTISAGQVKVLVTNDSYQSDPVVIFEGFLNCEAVNQDMLNFSNLTLTASGLLNKLQYSHPDSIDILQYLTLIDVINDCLTLTGAEYPIYVNCDLYEVNAVLASGQTLFNRTALYTELFWENNIERTSALDILETILKSFNCYLHWFNECWWIHHYEDINETRTYVVYTSGVSYGYTDTGGTSSSGLLLRFQVHESPFHDQVGGTQILTVIPGLRQLDIKLDQKDFYNLFNPDLSTSVDTPSAEPLLGRREWLSYEDAGPDQWSRRGETWRDISNSIRRFNYDITGGSLQLNGLTTRFTTSTNGYDTELIIAFKFGVHSADLLAPWFGDSQMLDNPQDTTITFYWYLCTYEAIIANRDFIWYNPATEEYELVADGDPQTEYNTLVITAADLDEDLLSYSGTINISLGRAISESSGDFDNLDMVFRMGTEMVSKTGESPVPATACYYGDFRASVSGAPENNLIRGDIVTDFLDKKTISLDLFDAGWNYRNALVRPTSFYYLTEEWGYGGTTCTLAQTLMKSKFRLYRIARQKIEMTVHSPFFPNMSILWPWEDSKQSNKIFIMLGHSFMPESNMHRVTLYEYDSVEVINLV